jgi:pimeloyl-ACP methyl ester carboxylesterase
VPYLETPDGVPLYYVDEGPRASSGLFLIHAEPFNGKFWKKNIPDLSRHFRVVAMDVRGRGESGKTDEGHTIAQYADDFQHMLEALGLEAVVAVGWSLGGSIIWSYLQRFGDARLVGYVNVDQPPYRFVSEEDLQERLTAIRTSRLRHHTNAVLAYLGAEAEKDEAVVKWMVYECMKTPTSAHVAAVTDSYRSDFRAFLPEVRLPTRIFWARYGSIRAPVADLMQKGMANSKAVFFERSGHLIPWVEADKFNRELAAFAGDVLGVERGR